MTPGIEIKQKILRIARKVFARDGLMGCSLKNVAEEAGVANSLINYHFTDRDGLFKACTELFAKERVEALNRLLQEPKSKEDFRVRLEMFVNEMILSHLADPDGFEIIHREAKIGNPQIIKLFKETIFHAFQNVTKFFASAQEKGFIRADVDPRIAAMLLFSSTCDTARNNHLAEKLLNVSLTQETWRVKVSEHIVELFMQGVVK